MKINILHFELTLKIIPSNDSTHACECIRKKYIISNTFQFQEKKMMQKV